MPAIFNHGGYCCGRRHLSGMNGATTASILSAMQANGLLRDDSNKLTEIVVSEENVGLEQLKREIVGAGFKLSASWRNCSGTTCWMYVHANDFTLYGPEGQDARFQAPPPAAPVDGLAVGMRVRNAVVAGERVITRLNETTAFFRYENGREMGWVRANCRPIIEPMRILSTFHNVLRAGRSDAGFATYEGARAAAPRAASVDRRDVFSDGSSTWTESVRG